MSNKMLVFSHLRLRRMRRGLALLAALLGTLLMGSVSFAQTGTVYTVSDDSSCTSFVAAIGADGRANGSECYIYSGTLPAADTLTIAGKYSLRPQSGGPISPNFTNYGVVNINSSARSSLYNAGVFDNRGSLNLNSASLSFDTINNTGTITIAADFYNNGALNNAGSIICLSGGSLLGSGTFSGNFVPTCDTTPPSVTINQAAGQADPTTSSPVLFTADFSEAVTGFTPADVSLSGTTNLSGATITVSGGPANYTISVGGLTSSGMVNATIAANGAVDKGGNGNLASTSTDNTVTVNFDSTGPVITPHVVGTPGNNDWYTSDVTVSWTVVDNESTVTSRSGCDPVTVNSDTAGITLTCTAGSSGGNSSQSVTIKRDATLPTISAAATSAPNAAGWYKSDVTVAFSCADNLSDVASCPADQTLSSEGSSVSSTAQSATDAAGNSSAPSNVVTVKIDRSAPSVSVSGVTNGASYTLGAVPTAACSTSDALSNVATVATLSITGGNADGTGSFTATCSGATDNAGNSGSASVSYTVGYSWSGFSQPVDNLPILNSVKAGSAIPVKFSLGGNYGLNIFAIGYPKVQQVACSSGAPVDEVEQTVTASTSSLQYDAASGQYSYTWKTDKKWAGQCRQLVLKLVDGTEHIAGFQFK